MAFSPGTVRLDSPLLEPQEMPLDEAAEFASICGQRMNFWLTFADAPLERAYRRWQSLVYERDMRMGLLLSNFLFFLASVVYACWSHEYTDTSPVYGRHLLVCDVLMGFSLTTCFGCAFLDCAVRRSYVFSTASLLLTSCFVGVRAYLLSNFAAVSSVVLVILIVCILLGSTLMRMPFFATFWVGLTLLAGYALLALLELQQAADGSGWYPAALLFVIASASVASRQLELAQRRLFLLQLQLRGTVRATSTRHLDLAAASAPPQAAADASAVPRSATTPPPPRAPPPHEAYGAVCEACGRLRPSSRDELLLMVGQRSPLTAELRCRSMPHLERSASDDAAAAAPRGMLGEMLAEFSDSVSSQRLTSIEAVHHALHASGVTSLREFLATAMLQHLPLPPWIMPSSPRDRGPTLSAGAQPSTPRLTFELVSSDELPPWFTPYPFVRTGYRVHFSRLLSLKSLFRLHNETINIWTELGPALGFLVWSITFLERHSSSSDTDRYIVGAGLLGSTVLRPLCSSLAHLMHCTSASGYIFWWSLDYCSICFAILASSIVSGHFAFYCLEPLQILFFTSTAGLLSTSIIAVLAVASPSLRATSFVLFVLFCNGVPFCYQACHRSQVMAKITAGRYHSDVPAAYIAYWGASLGCFLVGLLVKSSMLPEKAIQRPWSDIWAQSHQLWHIILNTAFVLGTFIAWDIYLEWRRDNECSDVHFRE
ncbi:hypothetical protein AB1Y20_006525 [Prymnesium parvum]|uniref:Uncharacterized protein n=1 Tax=Prymnesium parvum TaxID=97485 RepID=A0AB34J009_PRYPA